MEVKRDLGEGELGRGKRPRILIFIPLHALFARIGVEPVTRASTVLDICVGLRGVRTVCFLFILLQPLSGDPAHAMQRWCHATTATCGLPGRLTQVWMVSWASALPCNTMLVLLQWLLLTSLLRDFQGIRFSLRFPVCKVQQAAMSVAHHTHASFHNIK